MQKATLTTWLRTEQKRLEVRLQDGDPLRTAQERASLEGSLLTVKKLLEDSARWKD